MMGVRAVTISLALAIAGSLACLLCASAPAKVPSGDFAAFSRCPRFTPGVELCVAASITSGESRVGNAAVPIDKTITLQGGIIPNPQTNIETFVEAEGGETLSKTPLLVPGGLTGLISPRALPVSLQRMFAQVVNGGGEPVSAITELVGTPRISTMSLEIREGAGFSLPTRIKLVNQFLGSKCYVGSSSEPVVLELTDGYTSPPGPNLPIVGRFGKVFFSDEFELVKVLGDSLVDNSFSVPRVTGCGGPLAPVLDPLLDARLGLPSPAGNNTVIFNDTLQEGGVGAVIASEK